ncbi:hypothetical protein A3197_18465 [Candidatus Thiodiazotropha endoloripes]|nr:hypothetical protein A3197_18465 [Candidatus Thiodiazotropha endoloripes]
MAAVTIGKSIVKGICTIMANGTGLAFFHYVLIDRSGPGFHLKNCIVTGITAVIESMDPMGKD